MAAHPQASVYSRREAVGPSFQASGLCPGIPSPPQPRIPVIDAQPSRSNVTPLENQEELNNRVWEEGNYVKWYAGHKLRGAERVILDRYRGDLAGRVLELGCGGGRVTGHVIPIASSVHGLDISPAMVAHCRAAYPQATFSQGDLRDLGRFGDGSFEVVLAAMNIIDVLDDPGRRALLDEIHRVLSADGLLIMSSHSLAFVPSMTKPYAVETHGSMREFARSILYMPRRVRNHRRLAPLERREAGYAILNDTGLDFALLHYYITPDEQARQFKQLGFELLECVDIDGGTLAAGDSGSGCSELHYVARRGVPESV